MTAWYILLLFCDVGAYNCYYVEDPRLPAPFYTHGDCADYAEVRLRIHDGFMGYYCVEKALER